MRKSRFTTGQIIGFIRQVDAGLPVTDIRRQAGTRQATCHRWTSKPGGLIASESKRTEKAHAENEKLQRMFAELSPDNAAMKDRIARKP